MAQYQPGGGGLGGWSTAFGAGALGAGALGVAGMVDPNLFGGNYQQFVPGQANLPTFQYDPSNIVPTQSNLLGGIGGLTNYNIGAGFLPGASSIGQNLLGNAGFPQYFQGAITGAGLGQQAALNQFGAGGNIYQQAFDPQSALYNQYLALTTDQARANAMAAGLGTSPVGAGAVDWAQNQFNLDWANRQLGRQIQGAQAAAPLQAGAAPLFMQSAAYPWQVGQTVGGANLSMIGQLGQLGQQISNVPQTQIADWSSALTGMSGLQQQAFNQAQVGWEDQLRRAQQQIDAQKAQAAQQGGALGGLGNIAGTLGMMALMA